MHRAHGMRSARHLPPGDPASFLKLSLLYCGYREEAEPCRLATRLALAEPSPKGPEAMPHRHYTSRVAVVHSRKVQMGVCVRCIGNLLVN